MCEGRASFAVNHDGVEGACSEHEVLPIGSLTRLGSDHGWSCKWVSGMKIIHHHLMGVQNVPHCTQGKGRLLKPLS